MHYVIQHSQRGCHEQFDTSCKNNIRYSICQRLEVVIAPEITPSIAKKLPMVVKSALNNMSAEEQTMFQEQYEKKSKSTGLMVFLAIGL